MGFNETGPGCSDVGGSADEEQDNNDHTIETEESTLNKNTLTIDLHAVAIKLIL